MGRGAPAAPFINIDAVRDDVRPLFNRLRPALQMLVDRLRWDGFGAWAEAEMKHGLALMREISEQPPPVTIDQDLRVHHFARSWAGIFTQNLRKLWLDGHDDEASARLTQIAKQHRDAVYERNGWPEEESPYRPLDPDDS